MNDNPKRSAAIVGLAALAAVLTYYLLPASVNELARRSAAILVVAAIFWATEVIPLFATALLLVAMSIFFLAHQGGIAGALPTRSDFPIVPDGSGRIVELSFKTFLEPFASSIIILFMGGFLLSAAVTKTGLDRAIARKVLRPFTRSPLLLLFGVLGISAFFSMWMSNTATAAMMLAIIAPVVKRLDNQDRFHRAIILAVPFGANIGGIGTPIGTPPNAVGLAALRLAGYQVTFVDWMLVAVPLAILMLLVAGVLLYLFFPPGREIRLPAIEVGGPMTPQARLSLVILISAIVLWLTGNLHGIDSAVVALAAAAALTAFGILGRKDVDSIDWNILILMWGGLSLGVAMQKTGLVDQVTTLPIANLGTFGLALLMVGLAVVLSTFMSNTAAANILVPMAIGMSPAAPVQLAIITTLGCSFAMAMPISTPPNAIAFATGKIPVTAMIRSGGLISIIGIVVMLLGYQLVIPSVLALGRVDIVQRRIAVLLPQTGEYRHMGELQRLGYELARPSLQRAGITVRYFDTGGATTGLAALHDDQIAPWQADVIVGPYNSEAALALASHLKFLGATTPLIVPTANADTLTQDAKAPVYRLAPPMQMMALTAADFISASRDRLQPDDIIILAEDSPFARESALAITGSCLMKGLPTPRTIHYTDIAAALEAFVETPLTPRSLLIVISRSSDDCGAILEAFARVCPILGFSTGFATPAVTEFASRLALTLDDDVFVLTPWAADDPSLAVRAFMEQFHLVHPELSPRDPQYHTAQAYAALQVAGQAVEIAHREQIAPVKVLDSIVAATPLGPVRFIHFGGYHRQNPASAVVKRLGTDRAPTVFPPERVTQSKETSDVVRR